jgi:tRNA pseudouridine55 synthase
VKSAKSIPKIDINGILILDKPAGITSHDAVDFLRKRFALKKVGHAGTLDPAATGVLILLIGKNTKMSSALSDHDKTYEGEMRLGLSTDTHDSQGREVFRCEKSRVIDKKDLVRVFNEFTGRQMQEPPAYSALKHKGVPLYKYARKGIEVRKPAREINIKTFKLTYYEYPKAGFLLECSKGTYVRKICADIGDRLKCGAHLTRLRRIRSGNFDISESVGWDFLKECDLSAFKERLCRGSEI